MFKKIISIILTVAVVCSLVVPAVYADEPDCLTNGHSFSDPPGIMKGFDGEIQGFPVKVSIKYCSKCKFYFHECNVLGIKLEYMSLTGFTGIDGELQAFLFTQIGRIMGSNASATQFQAGGGSASPGGVGRRPDGYVDDSGTPYIGSSGVIYIAMEHDFIGFDGYNDNSYYCDHRNYTPPSSATLSPTYICRDDYMEMRVSSSSEKIYPDLDAGYKLVAPIDGYYSVVTVPQYSTICDSSNGRDFKYSGEFDVYLKDKFYPKDYVIKLSNKYSTHAEDGRYYYKSTFFRATISGSVILQVVPYEPIYKQQTNITINNNTWNGNIYVDNTNKLTYIYPQYTINNETKISNNPIIYNEETKQYYTYDQTTNNYYYITYNAPTPSPTPSPSPSPDPGGSAPDPDNPSPSPSPSTAPGGSSDKETGGNSFFNFIFGFGSDTGKDENGKKGIIWSLISLLVSCVTFVVGMGTAYSYLFPFLPPGLCTTIHICVLVLFLFAVIKFIRSFI